MLKSSLIKELAKFGFDEKMASLYLAGLMLGPVLMLTLAKTAKVKRSSAYYLMAELLRRGFFAKIQKGKRAYYLAASPNGLLKMTLEREKKIRRLLPELIKIVNSRPTNNKFGHD